MNALKAIWTVTMGVVPGVPMPEYSRQWSLTSADLDGKPLNEQGEAFRLRRDEATEYAADMQDPLKTNWVKMEFLWI